MNVLNLFFFLLACVVIGAAGYRFWYQKDFVMIVEAPCVSGEQLCFVRDCSTGECPPNGYHSYRTFELSARDFRQCVDGTCLRECVRGLVACEEVFCDAGAGDTCSQ